MHKFHSTEVFYHRKKLVFFSDTGISAAISVCWLVKQNNLDLPAQIFINLHFPLLLGG